MEYIIIFKDLERELEAVFTNEDKLNEFIKKYGCEVFDEVGEFPKEGEHYTITYYQDTEINPDYDKWLRLVTG